MILITGGLGFIGSHTTRALLELGERCVVTRHHATEVPEFLRSELGQQLVVEPLELEDRSALARIGERHPITGIVHLADSAVHRLWRQPGDTTALRTEALFDGLSRVLEAASDWRVSRVTVASTIGVYGGVAPGLWKEEMALPPRAWHAIPTVKKCTELLALFVGGQMGINVVCVRPSSIWGPGGRNSSSFFALPALVHAAARGQAGAGALRQPLYAQDGGDLCYVKDCGRAIALIQTARSLSHDTYNVGSGRVTTNAEVVAAIRERTPEVTFELTDGRSQLGTTADPVLDLTRIHRDTGYEPAYGIKLGIADYITWLQAGHDR